MDDMKGKFAEFGLRCTQQRLALYETLRSTKRHPTADELHQMVRDNAVTMSLATVYNTLEAFSEAGMCRKLATETGSTRYDADVSDHLHVTIRETGRLHDVPHELGQRLLDSVPHEVIAEIEERLGVRVDEVQVNLLASEPVGEA